MTVTSKTKVGLVFGSSLGLWHLSWAALVAMGLAQPLMNLVFRLHFIDPPYRIMPFRLDLALGLVALTFASGFLSGWVLAAIWNALHRAPRTTEENVRILHGT